MPEETTQEKSAPEEVETRPASKSAPQRRSWDVARVKCPCCNKTVYPQEASVFEGIHYHKQCIRCKKCNRKLSPSNLARNGDDFYCKPHLMQLFKEKGNYDEGFGRQTRAKSWSSEQGKAALEARQASRAVDPDNLGAVAEEGAAPQQQQQQQPKMRRKSSFKKKNSKEKLPKSNSREGGKLSRKNSNTSNGSKVAKSKSKESLKRSGSSKDKLDRPMSVRDRMAMFEAKSRH